MKLSALRCLLLALVFPCWANRVACFFQKHHKSVRDQVFLPPEPAEKGNKFIHAKSLRLEPTYMSLNIVTCHHHEAHFLGKVAEPLKKPTKNHAPVEQRLESGLRKVQRKLFLSQHVSNPTSSTVNLKLNCSFFLAFSFFGGGGCTLKQKKLGKDPNFSMISPLSHLREEGR